jgi:hypothetical protein
MGKVIIMAWALKIKMTHFMAKFTNKRIKLTNLFTKLIKSLVPHSGFFIPVVDTIIFLVVTLHKV